MRPNAAADILFAALSVLAIGGFVSCDAAAAADPDWKLCQSDNDTPEVRAIADCTALIDANGLSDRDRATAYYRRGAAYWRKQDLDHAIADETRAIELDSGLADAYLRR